jgi:hypothetical protein
MGMEFYLPSKNLDHSVTGYLVGIVVFKVVAKRVATTVIILLSIATESPPKVPIEPVSLV